MQTQAFTKNQTVFLWLPGFMGQHTESQRARAQTLKLPKPKAVLQSVEMLHHIIPGMHSKHQDLGYVRWCKLSSNVFRTFPRWGDHNIDHKILESVLDPPKCTPKTWETPLSLHEMLLEVR